MAEAQAVAFLGVARIQDQVILATCFDKTALNEEKRGFENGMAQLLARATTAYPGWKHRAVCQECDGVLHALADAQALCIVVAGIRDTSYPDRVANQLLRETADKVKNSQGDELLSEARAGTLTTPLRKLMRDLMKQYNDSSAHDKTTEVNQKVDQLKGIMQDNVKRILETHTTLEGLENSSSSMSSQANKFLRQSVDLRRQIQLRNLKVKLVFGACVLAVILYVALPFIPSD